MTPGSTVPLNLNCSLSGVKTNVMHKARVFYSVSDNYNYLMRKVSDEFENMISIWAVSSIGFRSDMVIAEINNLPDSRILTWATPFTLEVTVVTDGYTESTLPINNFAAIIYDDMYNITELNMQKGIAISDKSTFHLEFPISIPVSIKNGKYNFPIMLSSPQNNNKYQIPALTILFRWKSLKQSLYLMSDYPEVWSHLLVLTVKMIFSCLFISY